MKNNKYVAKFSFWGYLLFFFPLCLTIGFAIAIFSLAIKNNASNAEVFVYELVYVLFITLLFCLIDIMRRRVMVDKPAEQILDATERIAKGDFKVKLIPLHTYYKYDKYDKIMENINKMATELDKSEILKSEFISNFSHEVKTPLSVIISYLKALKKGGLSKENEKKYLDTILISSEKLSNLINNILKLTKLENQTINEIKEEVDASELLRTCIIQQEEKLDAKNIILSCDIDEIVCTSDKTYLEIIFNNLISNAIKFTLEGGLIDISLKRRGQGFVFEVKDSGIGMSQSVGIRIFDKFYQGDTSHTSEGNGLGLSLVKKVIDILGGEIKVESQEGEGSTFTVIIKRDKNGEV